LRQLWGKYNPNNKGWQFWQQHNHPIELFDRKIMEQKLDNVHKILFRQDLSAARLIGFTAAEGIMPGEGIA